MEHVDRDDSTSERGSASAAERVVVQDAIAEENGRLCVATVYGDLVERESCGREDVRGSRRRTPLDRAFDTHPAYGVGAPVVADNDDGEEHVLVLRDTISLYKPDPLNATLP